jgi:hypothetical protein
VLTGEDPTNAIPNKPRNCTIRILSFTIRGKIQGNCNNIKQKSQKYVLSVIVHCIERDCHFTIVFSTGKQTNGIILINTLSHSGSVTKFYANIGSIQIFMSHNWKCSNPLFLNGYFTKQTVLIDN